MIMPILNHSSLSLFHPASWQSSGVLTARLAGGMYPESGPRWRRGAEATRTPGLLHAMQALYQLSYSPAPLTIAPLLRRLHEVVGSVGGRLVSTRRVAWGTARRLRGRVQWRLLARVPGRI